MSGASGSTASIGVASSGVAGGVEAAYLALSNDPHAGGSELGQFGTRFGVPRQDLVTATSLCGLQREPLKVRLAEMFGANRVPASLAEEPLFKGSTCGCRSGGTVFGIGPTGMGSDGSREASF